MLGTFILNIEDIRPQHCVYLSLTLGTNFKLGFKPL